MHYVLWRRSDKVPLDASGEPCDAQASRLTRAEADAAAALLGHGVGLVIEPPLFFVDLDHAYDPAAGAWAPYVADVLARFPGAYVEVSQSGTGLHIIGSYTGPRPVHRTRDATIRAELYTGARYCALTGTAATGDPAAEHTAALHALVVARFMPRTRDEAGRETEWTDGPVLAWRGPVDDVELVAKARRARSAAAVFGNGASFAALWDCDGDALARAFPPQTAASTFDHSAADLALANHLAYWTGNDCERIVRLMRASGLARNKYEREDYMRSTVLRACADQRSWYSGGAGTAAPGAPKQAQNAAAAGPPAATSPGQPLPAVATPPGAGGPVGVITYNSKGLIESTTSNLVHILGEGDAIRLAYDDFLSCVMLRSADEWQPLTDTDVTRIMQTLELLRVAPCARDTLRNAIELVAHTNAFDSARDWLAGLSWDGTPRIGGFFATHCGAADDEYTRAVSAYLWTALAGRVLDPGCQADMVPVLIGPQGCGKSSGVRAMAPRPDLHVEISLAERDDNLSRRMRGRIIGELGELNGLGSRDGDALKAFISTRHDTWTPKYKEFNVTAGRRITFIGTTNQERFLQDETGERRWLPVLVQRLDVERIAADRDQLWAEARAAHAAFGIVYGPAERLARERHAEHTVDDPWSDGIADWAAMQTAPFSTADALHFGAHVPRSQMTSGNDRRAAKVLIRLGYRNDRVYINSVRSRRWATRQMWTALGHLGPSWEKPGA